MYQDTSHAQIFFGGKSKCGPPCDEVFRQRGSAGGAHHFPMLTFARAGPQLLALCFRLFFWNWVQCMYQDTSHAQLFLVGNPSAPPLATKFLDKEAAQGAHITFQ